MLSRCYWSSTVQGSSVGGQVGRLLRARQLQRPLLRRQPARKQRRQLQQRPEIDGSIVALQVCGAAAGLLELLKPVAQQMCEACIVHELHRFGVNSENAQEPSWSALFSRVPPLTARRVLLRRRKHRPQHQPEREMARGRPRGDLGCPAPFLALSTVLACRPLLRNLQLRALQQLARARPTH